MVASAADDWTLGQVVPVISVVFAIQGVSAAVFGKWMEARSPRLNGLISAACFGGGLMLSGVGVMLHSLPLLYLGYGVLGGIGVGVAYVPAVKNLMGWYPDRTGFASGVTMMGFGGGALVATPIADKLMKYFSVAPKFLGSQANVNLLAEDGRRFALMADGSRVECVLASAADLGRASFAHLPEGVYAIGTGSSGVGETLAVFGAAYLGVMATAALAYRMAPVGFTPAGWTRPAAAAAGGVRTYVHIDTLMKTPQFWMIFTSFAGIASAGLAVSSVARTMMTDIFGSALPAVVTAGFASGYLMAMSVANLGGRLVWSSASDIVGRRNMFLFMSIGSIPLYLCVPWLVKWVSQDPSMTPLVLFYGASLLSYSFFGATYAMLPAYEGDMFGQETVTATHGRMLLASTFAALVGPSTLVFLRNLAERKEIRALAAKCDPENFKQHFGVAFDYFTLEKLIDSKAVTINKLLEICPPGTLDPTPFLYNSTMYVAAGIMSVSALSFALQRPVASKYLTVVKVPEKQ